MLDLADEDNTMELEQFSMLIRTKRFKTVGDVDLAVAKLVELEEEKEGLVINQFDADGLDSEENQLISESFPKLDLDKVVLVAEGVDPPTILGALIAMAVGSFFFFGAGYLIISGD